MAKSDLHVVASSLVSSGQAGREPVCPSLSFVFLTLLYSERTDDAYIHGTGSGRLGPVKP